MDVQGRCTQPRNFIEGLLLGRTARRKGLLHQPGSSRALQFALKLSPAPHRHGHYHMETESAPLGGRSIFPKKIRIARHAPKKPHSPAGSAIPAASNQTTLVMAK